MYTELTASAQTAYAQLFEACETSHFLRSAADLSGSFAAKVIKGRRYWYFQYTEPAGKLRQVYVGPDSSEVHALIARKKVKPASREAIGRLARSATALGCEEVLPRDYRVIERLADYGFFRAGGILTGAHAFISYGNLLGVHWGIPDHTQDVGFVHAGRNLAIALPSILKFDSDNAIKSLSMGFLPINGLTDKSGATYLSPRDPEFRLEFITPLHGEAGPYVHEDLGVRLSPSRFMEYPLERIQQAVIFSAEKAVIVNVTDPARYALHKLLFLGEHISAPKEPLEKHIKQVVSLLLILKDRHPFSVEEAWLDLLSRGPDWRKYANLGLEKLERELPQHGLEKWLRSLKPSRPSP